MRGVSNDTSKCTVQAKQGRNGKVVFANLPRLGYSLAYGYNAFFVWEKEALNENKADKTNARKPCLFVANDRVARDVFFSFYPDHYILGSGTEFIQW